MFDYANVQWNWASLVAQLLKNPSAMRETWVPSLGWEDLLEKGKGYPLQHFGLENSMDCIVREVAKSRTLLSNFHFHFHSVETTYDRITVNTEKVISKYSAQTNKMR